MMESEWRIVKSMPEDGYYILCSWIDVVDFCFSDAKSNKARDIHLLKSVNRLLQSEQTGKIR